MMLRVILFGMAQHIHSIAVQSDFYCGERVVTLVGYGLQIAGNEAVRLRMMRISERAAYALSDLDHSYVMLGPVIPISALYLAKHNLDNLNCG